MYYDPAATGERICNELFTWADVYDTANHDERRAILQQFIKEIRVRKDYEISITLNASFNQVEQLKAVSTYDGAEISTQKGHKSDALALLATMVLVLRSSQPVSYTDAQT